MKVYKKSSENSIFLNCQSTSSSWLLRFFESKHFDMSIAISYLFNSKEQGVQTYLCNRLFSFPNNEVDFYLPQLLNIYIYSCNDNHDALLVEMLYSYFRKRCSCQNNGVDFSLRCYWLLDAHINDNAKFTSVTANSKEFRIKKGLNNAIKLYKLIISERLRPTNHNKEKILKRQDIKNIDFKKEGMIFFTFNYMQTKLMYSSYSRSRDSCLRH
jgi:phosphatidylinositol 4-kinase